MGKWNRWADAVRIEPVDDRDAATKVRELRHRLALWSFDTQLAEACTDGELVSAALAYLCSPGEEVWPFEPESFYPGDMEDNLIWAAALLAAEADRITRARARGDVVTSGFVILGADPETYERCVDGLRSIRQQLQKRVAEAS